MDEVRAQGQPEHQCGRPAEEAQARKPVAERLVAGVGPKAGASHES